MKIISEKARLCYRVTGQTPNFNLKFHDSPFFAGFSAACSRGVASFPQGMGSNVEHFVKEFRFRSVVGRRGDALRLVRADTELSGNLSGLIRVNPT